MSELTDHPWNVTEVGAFPADAWKAIQELRAQAEVATQVVTVVQEQLAAARAERDLAQTSGVEHANYWQEQAKDYKENSALFLKQRDELQSDLAAARARIAELEAVLTQQILSEMKTLDRAHDAELDLAAARALLLSAAELLDEVQSYTSHAAHSPSMTRDCAAAVARIHAVLAGKDAT